MTEPFQRSSDEIVSDAGDHTFALCVSSDDARPKLSQSKPNKAQQVFFSRQKTNVQIITSNSMMFIKHWNSLCSVPPQEGVKQKQEPNKRQAKLVR